MNNGHRSLLRRIIRKRHRTMRRHLCIISSIGVYEYQLHSAPMKVTPSSYDFEEAAIKTASKKTFAFYSTAATDCWSRDMNNSMYKRLWFRPRVMKDVAEVDTSSSVLGIPVNVPLFICPTGLAKMINPDGEKALARAAKSTGILEVVSSVTDCECVHVLNNTAIHKREPPVRRHPSRSTRLSILIPALRQQRSQEIGRNDQTSYGVRCQSHIRHGRRRRSRQTRVGRTTKS